MSEIDWALLKQLRQSYLDAQGFLPEYWQSEKLLEAYEQTLGARIGWKWQAVLEILADKQEGWPLKVPRLIDWGCGTGIAARKVLASGLFACEHVSFYDRSPRAASYAQRRLREEFPRQASEAISQLGVPREDFVLLISHVLSELSEKDRQNLVELATRASLVLWVEAGRQQESRWLNQVRDACRGKLEILAPCTHQAPCGMLAADQAGNWCHFFAAVPSEVFRSAFWRKASQELGIDLRSLPLSYLVAARREGSAEKEEKVENRDWRILGRGRANKAYCRWIACGPQGIREGHYLKRHSRELYGRLEKPGLGLQLSSADLLGKSE